jgi:hypothetical protein
MGGVVNGPAPKRPEDRARVNKPPVAPIVLPAEGYQGPIPPWPLARKSANDAQLWADLWRTPQAAAWAPMGLGTRRAVARLVVMSRGAAGDARMSAEVRQLEQALGLLPLAMLRLGWAVATDELEPRRDDDPPAGSGRSVRLVAD